MKAIRSAATILTGLLTNDLEAGPSALDLVVTRLDTGNAILRVTAGTVSEADHLLRRVRRDLDVMNVELFIREWGTGQPGQA
ncbi:hypothetical protein GCM10009777_39270 [Microbacterium pumilum]|uniref:BON domain-containing protein n=1 Tax=Microbacterium pumilum TaxID=344165 RepID=A0ABN2T3V8_9MICO